MKKVAAASVYPVYRVSPLKHHATGRQWCPNPDHYPDSEQATPSLTLMFWALSRVAEPQILTCFYGANNMVQNPDGLNGKFTFNTGFLDVFMCVVLSPYHIYLEVFIGRFILETRMIYSM